MNTAVCCFFFKKKINMFPNFAYSPDLSNKDSMSKRKHADISAGPREGGDISAAASAPKGSTMKANPVSLHIGYHPDLYKKSGGTLCVAIPDTLTQVKPSTKESTDMFGYRKSEFYPLAILDENNVVQKHITDHIQYSLVWYTLTGESTSILPSSCGPVGSGIYWFRAIKSFVNGSFKMTFTCPANPLVTPLVQNIVVIPDQSIQIIEGAGNEIKMLNQRDRLLPSYIPSAIIPFGQSRIELSPYLHLSLRDNEVDVKLGRIRSIASKPSFGKYVLIG
jgi:hypothetical protein